ncbi:MAG: TetR/AcrR family transcriptional regulator [Gemmatimonadales bacterium]|nr:TetR/AcrR family transcriptional regulator [Gemmatimonadales bacterium]
MPWERQFDVDEMLGKAMSAFWRRGYEATSVQDLVDETGVGRGSLYATYPDKHALFLAALRMYDDRNRRVRLVELERTLRPRQAIEALFQSFTAKIKSGSAAADGCFLTNTALEMAPRDPEAAEIVGRAQAEIEAFFRRTVRRGIRDGAFRPDLDPDAAASGLLASLIGVTVLIRSRPEPKLLARVVREAVDRLG